MWPPSLELTRRDSRLRPKPAVEYEDSGRERVLQRRRLLRRHEQLRRRDQVRRRCQDALRWCVLFSAPTLALFGMAVWAMSGESSPRPSALPRTNVELEATVKAVDAGGGKVHLTSEMLGIFGATLYVTSDTKVELAGGKHGNVADLHEGTDVRAAYDLTEGRKMASRIVVVPKGAGAEGGPRQETGQLSTGRR